MGLVGGYSTHWLLWSLLVSRKDQEHIFDGQIAQLSALITFPALPAFSESLFASSPEIVRVFLTAFRRIPETV